MKLFTFLVFFLFCCSLAGKAQQVPGTLSYQGILLQNDSITPLEDSGHTIAVNFYTVASGGASIPGLNQRLIPITTSKGLFTCIIGGGTTPASSTNEPFTPTEIELLGKQQIFIGIAVDGGPELAPRAQLTTSAYAFRTESISNPNNPSSGQIAFWGSNNTIRSDAELFWDNTTNKRLGIGTITPQASIEISGDGSKRRGIRLTQTTAGVSWALNNFETSASEGAGNFGINQVGLGNRFTITTSGNVGIGTSAPNYTLDVNGDINGNNITSDRIFSGSSIYADGFIELFRTIPYIDFHFDASGVDYTSRIFEPASGLIRVIGALDVPTTITAGNIGIGTTPSYKLHVVDGQIRSENSDGGASIGVYGKGNGFGVRGEGGTYGVYGSGTSYGVFCAGNLAYTGTITDVSDRKLKKGIQPMNETLLSLLQMKPCEFFFKTDEYNFMSLPKGKQLGLIAQEVESLFPEVVTNNIHPGETDMLGNVVREKTEFKGIDYTMLVPVLIKSVQEQQSQIEELKTYNQKLEQRLQQLESWFSKNTSENSTPPSKSEKR